jgi:hypothetical protein
MRVNIYKPIVNEGRLEMTNERIDIRTNRWIDSNHTSHPLKYTKPVAFSNKNVYFLHLFSDENKKSFQGKHISLSFFENQLFHLKQGSHWIQKENNIRYLINLIYLTIGLIFAFRQL